MLISPLKHFDGKNYNLETYPDLADKVNMPTRDEVIGAVSKLVESVKDYKMDEHDRGAKIEMDGLEYTMELIFAMEDLTKPLSIRRVAQIEITDSNGEILQDTNGEGSRHSLNVGSLIRAVEREAILPRILRARKANQHGSTPPDHTYGRQGYLGC